MRGPNNVKLCASLVAPLILVRSSLLSAFFAHVFSTLLHQPKIHAPLCCVYTCRRAPSTDILDLPQDVLALVLSYASVPARGVCTEFREAFDSTVSSLTGRSCDRLLMMMPPTKFPSLRKVSLVQPRLEASPASQAAHGKAFALGLPSCLQELHLQRCSKEFTRATLANLDGGGCSLVHLAVERCDLESLPSNVGRIAALEHLDISNNKLRSLPTSLGKLRQLRLLYVGGNRLTQVTKVITTLTALETLRLNDNRIQELPQGMNKLSPRLKVLDLSGNRCAAGARKGG